MSDAAPGHQTETGDAEHNAVSDDTGDDTDAVARAHSHLTAYRNQVALLNHLTTNGLQIQDTHIKDTESVDGTLVSIDAVVPDDWLESAPDRGRPDRASRHEHEATQLDDIESSIQGLEAHVDAISDRLDTFEDRLDSFEANTTDDPIDWDALDAHVDIPAWLGEGTLVEAVGESESIRDLEHTLGWDGDRRQLRCITWLAGWYSDLPEPEAKHDPKYTPGGGA